MNPEQGLTGRRLLAKIRNIGTRVEENVRSAGPNFRRRTISGDWSQHWTILVRRLISGPHCPSVGEGERELGCERGLQNFTSNDIILVSVWSQLFRNIFDIYLTRSYLFMS